MIDGIFQLTTPVFAEDITCTLINVFQRQTFTVEYQATDECQHSGVTQGNGNSFYRFLGLLDDY